MMEEKKSGQKGIPTSKKNLLMDLGVKIFFIF